MSIDASDARRIVAVGLLALGCLAITRNGPATAQSDSEIANEIVERTNSYRQKKGLGPLESNDALRETAGQFACYMARTGDFSHTADDRQPWERAKSNGFPTKCVAENIAMRQGYGRSTLAEGFTQGWIDSPGHRRNMLAPGATVTGVAICDGSEGKVYAVQLIGARRLKSVEISNSGRSGTLDYAVRYAQPSGPRTWGTSEKTGEIGPGGWARIAFCWSGTLELTADGKQLMTEDIDGQAKFDWAQRDGRWQRAGSPSPSAD